MRIPRIHTDLELAPDASVTLEGPAFNHLVRVLRLRPGAPVLLFNGSGGQYRAVLEAVERRRARVRVASFDPLDVESPLAVTLAQGVSRGERMDYTVQKAVELGVGAIRPLLTERSVVNLQGERLDKRLDHWRGVVIGACEQSGRNRPPPVLAPLSLTDWLTGTPPAGLVLDPEAGAGLLDLERPAGAVTLLVGPEGGLSEAELELARRAGFRGVRLGPRVMRTETAGIAALAALQLLWGDLGR